MAETLLYTSTNEYKTYQVPAGHQLNVGRLRRAGSGLGAVVPTAAKGADTGWCIAASARWCHHVLQGKPPAFDPVGNAVNKSATGALMGMYRWDQAGSPDDELHVLEKLGITGEATGAMYLEGVLHRMASVKGVYFFTNAVHALAASTRLNSIYFYDIEEGLWHFDTIDEWKGRIRQGYGRAGGGGRQWCAIQCTF
jgi:hypothetical protein